jgi:hypothetical protein
MGTVSLKIVLVYGNKASARLGAKVSNSLRRRLGSDFNVAQSIWNMELLKSAKLRAMAADEARDSDVVIVSTEEGAPLSPEITQWFELWEARQRSAPSALVALLKQERGPKKECVARESLHQFAERANMEFFCHSEAAA